MSTILKHFGKNKKLTAKQWFRYGFGRWVAREEKRLCHESIRDVLGLYGVQLGGRAEVLAASPVRHQLLIARRDSTLCADWRELPIESEALDLLVLVHVLEASNDPHAVLREAVRVLRPEGRLVIIGFNRFSLLRFARAAPWRENWLSVARINDWLKLLEMQSLGGAYAVFLPPWVNLLQRRWRMRWFELAGRRWWPLAGGIFVSHTVKRRHSMRLIVPALFKQQRKKAALARYKSTKARL
ncbi:MAG: class I SAM-dependent methyltransferase [Proteobacteria bacterium]|nr:class I SAM-dependent methyltransferase [Pseudomonadota bacterium]